MYYTESILYIKNLVCRNCLKVTRQVLTQNGLLITKIDWERVAFHYKTFGTDFEKIDNELADNGLKIISSEKEIKAEQIKNLLIHHIYIDDLALMIDEIPSLLSEKMKQEFTLLNIIFLEINGYAISEYVEKLRFERAKELISYKERALNEIAGKLGYSDIVELKLLFIKLLHQTVDEFLKSPNNYRIALDQL